MIGVRQHRLRLTKRQRARAERVCTRAITATTAALGTRLRSRVPVMVGGEPERWFACVELTDPELTYTLWFWVTRRDPGR